MLAMTLFSCFLDLEIYAKKVLANKRCLCYMIVHRFALNSIFVKKKKQN